jgi:hypothetical protein
MPAHWTDWKSFPDAYHGEYIEAPIGPGVYEVCDASTREQVAFGCTRNVAETLLQVLTTQKARRQSFFRHFRKRTIGDVLEYRSWPTASMGDAKVAVGQILGQREALIRRFAQGTR